MRLKPRVEALEKRNPQWKPWHRLIVHPGETVEEVQAAYEAENGPIGDDHCIIIRLVVPPERKELSCA